MINMANELVSMFNENAMDDPDLMGLAREAYQPAYGAAQAFGKLPQPTEEEIEAKRKEAIQQIARANARNIVQQVFDIADKIVTFRGVEPEQALGMAQEFVKQKKLLEKSFDEAALNYLEENKEAE